MNEEQIASMKYLNYHHNADVHEVNWDTFINSKGMTYFMPNDRWFEL